MLPIYRSSKNKPSGTKSIAETITNNNVPCNFIANATPVYVQHNVDFFVDSLKLGDWRDIKNDSSIGMYRTATKTSYFSNNNEEVLIQWKRWSTIIKFADLYIATKSFLISIKL